MDPQLSDGRGDRAASVEASLAYYPSGAQAPHGHDYDQISLLLTGEMREESGGWEADLCRTAIGFKPAGTRHSNCWGPDGALFFSLKLAPGACPPELAPRRGWSAPAAAAELRRLARACLTCADPAGRADLAWDFVARAGDAREPVRGPPPLWLAQARASLRDAPGETGIGSLAARLGVHRVHLSRMFARHYGLAPSRFRTRCLAMKAVAGAAAAAEPLTWVALDAGFCDHSHAARVVRNRTGFTMAELRALLAPLHPSKRRAGP
jgi:AraC family transcriptional regulator